MKPERRVLGPVKTIQRDSDAEIDKVLVSEQSVLGALLIPANGFEVWEKVASTGLSRIHFSTAAHAVIFEHMAQLADQGQPIDLTTVSDSLSASNELELVGGFAYLARIAHSTPSVANVRAYAMGAIRFARDRELIRIAGDDTPHAEKLERLRQFLSESAARDFIPAFHAVDLNNFMSAELPEQRFVIDPIFPRRSATLLGGHGGIGKSQCALILCAHAAAGMNWAGFAVTRGRVLFCSLEDDAAMVQRRLRKIVRSYQLDIQAIAANLQIIDGTEGDAALMVEAAEYPHQVRFTAAFKKLEALSTGADLIVIDNASDAFLGNENSRRDVRAFMRALTQLARVNDAAVVLLAHIDKNAARNGSSGNSYSGSTAWHNSSRSRLALVEENSTIELRHEKSNVSKRADVVRLAFDTHGVLMPADRVQDFSQVADEVRARTDAEQIYRVVELAIKADITITTATVGAHTAWHAVQPLPELGQIFRTKDGKQRFNAALLRLLREGRLVKIEYTKPNRHPGERFDLAQPASEVR